ncbi:MAG: manganese efflux pump [Ruminococcus sp.]|nr:manganese efflux pump [Ruminococcus sp.]
MQKELFLAVIVSVDTYLAAAAYCNSGIRIPIISAAVINLLSGAVLFLALRLSGILREFVSADFFHTLSVGILTFIGAVTIFKSLVRSLSSFISEKGDISLKMGKSPIVLKLYLDETAADFDNSKSLSAGEAAALALASSSDSAAIGLSSGFSEISPLSASVCAVLCGFIAILIGNLTGKKISSLHHDFSWVGGVMLILFALFI